MTKNNEVIAEKPFQNSGVTRCLWRFTRHAALLERSVEVGFSLILLIYKVVYIRTEDLYVGYAVTRWRNLLLNMPKTKLHYAIKDS